MAWIILEDESISQSPESALDVIASNFATIKEFAEAYICNEDIAIVVPSLGMNIINAISGRLNLLL